MIWELVPKEIFFGFTLQILAMIVVFILTYN